MKHTIRIAAGALALTAAALTSLWANAHGNVVPQGVDTTGLPTNKLALKIGASAYTQNCARCHGLEAVSGGIAPDLRLLDRDCTGIKNEKKKDACYKEVDNYYLTSIRHGKVRNGAVYMPPFEGVFNQEAMWAIKTYLESRRAAD
jgi:cytochrome c-550 PedF